jgi:hypothetical protein
VRVRTYGFPGVLRGLPGPRLAATPVNRPRRVTFCGVTFHSLRLTHGFVTSRPAGRRITASPTTLTQQRLPSMTLRKFGRRGTIPQLKKLRWRCTHYGAPIPGINPQSAMRRRHPIDCRLFDHEQSHPGKYALIGLALNPRSLSWSWSCRVRLILLRSCVARSPLESGSIEGERPVGKCGVAL